MKPKKINRATAAHAFPIKTGGRVLRAHGRGRATPLPRQATAETRTVAPPPAKIILRLFVAGATARSQQAILRVRELCQGEPHDRCELEVIDIYQQPKLARDNQIVATPTLIKELPNPVRRFIGNLLNTDGLYLELNLVPKRSVIL